MKTSIETFEEIFMQTSVKTPEAISLDSSVVSPMKTFLKFLYRRI